MARGTIPDKAAKRHPFGPRPISALLPACTRSAFRHRSPATQRLLLDWPLVVGPAIAAMALPERLARGTLTLACSGPAALELQHTAPSLIERINTYFGGSLVARLALRQGPAPPEAFATGSDRQRRSSAPEVPAKLVGMPEGELRAALALLGQTIAVAAEESD